MGEEDELERCCAALPIFPLPRVVLMPGDVLPLHVFEPRYRALLAYCLENDGLMGIATLLPSLPDVDGRPAISGAIGVGRIVSHQPYPDGRANIVLDHVARVRAVRELASPHPFRMVEARPCPEIGAGESLTGLRALVLQLAATSPNSAADAQQIVGLDDRTLVDELARRLLDDTDERLRYISLDALDARASLIEGYLAGLYLASHPPSIDA